VTWLAALALSLASPAYAEAGDGDVVIIIREEQTVLVQELRDLRTEPADIRQLELRARLGELNARLAELELRGRLLAHDERAVAELGIRMDAVQNQIKMVEDSLERASQDLNRRHRHVDDDRVSITGPIVIREGEEVGDVVALMGQDVFVFGRITGDVTTFGGDLHVGPSGQVDGDSITMGGQVILVEPHHAAQGANPLQAEIMPSFAGPSRFVRSLIWFLSMAGAGVFLTAMAPLRLEKVAAGIQDSPVRSGVVGAASALGLVLAAVLFAVTIIGIPIAVLMMAILGLAGLIGFVAIAELVGGRIRPNHPEDPAWLTFLTGAALLTLATSLPWLGKVLGLLVSAVGVGGVLLTRMGSREPGDY